MMPVALRVRALTRSSARCCVAALRGRAPEPCNEVPRVHSPELGARVPAGQMPDSIAARLGGNLRNANYLHSARTSPERGGATARGGPGWRRRHTPSVAALLWLAPGRLRGADLPLQGEVAAHSVSCSAALASAVHLTSAATLTVTMRSGSETVPLLAWLPFLSLSTTSIPETTSPTTVYLPFKKSPSSYMMKN
jgi:hypothetical protein